MRRIVSTMLLLCLAFTVPQSAEAAGKKKAATPPNSKYASIVIDAETGAVVSESNPNKLLHPASLTKMMTLMLLFEALENGNVRLNDKIMISRNAADEQPSKLGLGAGASIRVEDAILAVVTKSANDVAAAIAEHLAGSESRFALRMTRRAHDIGMTRTIFKNPHGLHDPQQVTTARDMATLARYILARYPNYYRYFGTKQFTYRGKTYTNHNRLMQTYPGMDGFKTGFINASGFNLVASAKHDGKRLIGVVFGGKSWKSRNDHMASLLNTGFVKLPAVQFAAKSQEIAKTAAVAPAPARNYQPVITAQASPPQRRPEPKPVFRTTGGVQGTGTLQLPQEQAAARDSNYTSLAAMSSGQRVVVAPAPQKPEPDVATQAAASVSAAINRGDYSELTGEGDYDAGTARRVETGLLAAAVYKGEHARAREIQARAAAAGTAQQPPAVNNNNMLQTALPPAAPPASDLWSVQIGAYTSRVATDDALRTAHGKLPSQLSHASPLVVPLKTAEGLLFRARLGGLSKDQAADACRYFRDCLPIEPR